MKFKKISAVLGTMLLTGLTLGTAAAATYPAPFIDNGSGDVAIVYGTGAGVNALDLEQAQDIQGDLGNYVSGGTTTFDGDSVLIEGTGNELTFGEPLNNVTIDLDETDFSGLLARGELIDDEVEYGEEEEIEYTQEIALSGDAVTFGDLDEDDYAFNKGLAGDELPLLYIDQTSGVAYTLEVDFANAINATAYDNSEAITIFGKTLVFDQEMDTSSTKLTFFESTETVTLDMGETKTLDGKQVEVVGGTETKANIKIDGTIHQIEQGDTKEGLYVSKVITSSLVEETITVELFVGANEWVLEDGQEIEVDGNDIDGVVVDFGTDSITALNGITFTVTPSNMDSDELEYLEIGESFIDPLFGSFALLFDSVSPELDADSKDKIELDAGTLTTLSFTSRNGNEYEITPFEISADDTEVVIEDDWFVHANYTGLEEDHIFIASEGTLKSEETLIYQVDSIMDGESTPYVVFKELSSGTTTKVYEFKELADTDMYVSNITDGDDSFDLVVGSEESGDQLAVDMNNELITEGGMSIELTREATIEVTGTELGEDTNITLNGDEFVETWDSNADTTATNLNGTLADAGYDVSVSGAEVTISGFEVNTLVNNTFANTDVTTEISFEEDADDVFSLDSEVTTTDLIVGVGVDTSDDELEFSVTEGDDFTSVSNTETDIEYGLSELGTYYEFDTDEKASLDIWTPMEGQTVYNVYVAEGEASTSNDALGDVLIKDTEAATSTANNLIVVGGSCINSAAATLLGGNYCGAAFTEATDVVDGEFLIKGFENSAIGGKFALLVAGYEAADTVNAATYLTNKDVDTSEAYIGTSTNTADLVVA